MIINSPYITGSINISGVITGSLSGSVTGSLFGTASQALTASYLLGYISPFPYTGSASITGSLRVSGSTNISASSYALAMQGSGSGVFTVDGTSGRLFQVDDSLSGSLFSVNTAAGLPVIEAFSDNTVRMGKYGTKALFVSQSSIGIGKETALNGVLDISGSVYVTGTTIFDGVVSGSQPANNPSSSLIVVSGSFYASGSRTSAVYIAPYLTATGSAQILEAVNINPSFSGSTTSKVALRISTGNLIIGSNPDGGGRQLYVGGTIEAAGSVLTPSISVNSIYSYSVSPVSIASATGVVNISGSNINLTGSVNITGSLTTIGNITTTGTITAQTLVVSTISSSVEYSSGSNIFGNSLTNQQIFTGSVNITGSLALSGNIAIQTGSVTQPYTLHTVRYGGSSGNLLLEGNDTIVGQPAITFKNNNGNITNNISQLGGAGGLNLNGVLYITASNVGIGTSTVSESVQATGTISIIPNSSVSSGPLIQFAGNGRIRPASTGDRLSIDGNPLYLNNSFNTNVVIGAGNLGLGVVPTANWGTTAIQMNHYSSVSAGDDGSRAYATFGFGMYDGGYWTPKYLLGGSAATAYRQRDGAHEFYTAGTGTINTAITFTQAMTITSGGSVGIGTTSPNYKLDVSGSIGSLSIYGAAYAQTSASGGTSIVDTGLSLPNQAIYLLTISGNPNGLGSGIYAYNEVGYVMCDTQYNGSFAVNYITYTKVAGGPTGVTPGALTISAVFNVAGYEVTNTTSYQPASSQIRIKVAGYNSSAVGQNQTLRLMQIQ